DIARNVTDHMAKKNHKTTHIQLDEVQYDAREIPKLLLKN
ncbi:1127_t:CDS:1, partial [Entrophospora sp. SA101]